MQFIYIAILWAIVTFVDTTTVVWWIKHKNNILLPFGITSASMFAVQVFADKLSIWSFGIVAPSAIVLYIDMLIINDLVNEKFGRKVALNMAILSFIPGALMLTFGYITTLFAQPSFAVLAGYNSIFSVSVRIGIASFIAFTVDYLFDTYVYSRLKVAYKGRKLYIRYLGAEIPTIMLDSAIFITIAFFATMPTAQLLTLIKSQMLMKYLLGIPAIAFMYYGRWLLYRKPPTKTNKVINQYSLG